MKSRRAAFMCACLFALASCTSSPGALAPQSSGSPSVRSHPAKTKILTSFTPVPIAVALRGPGVPLIYRIPTTQRVVFITIDDGFWPDDRVAALIEKDHLPISMFLIAKIAKLHLPFFKRLQKDGATIEDHTIHHYLLPHYPDTWQYREICDALPMYQQMFGTTPTLFRPPGGAFTPATLKLAHACGLKAAIMWSAEMRFHHLYLEHGSTLQPGDIILCHFRDAIAFPGRDLYGDLQILLAEMQKLHLRAALLEDYLEASL
ncbi:MAG: polysaccharide deacetylase family protein [Actinomycetota bacterium]